MGVQTVLVDGTAKSSDVELFMIDGHLRGRAGDHGGPYAGGNSGRKWQAWTILINDQHRARQWFSRQRARKCHGHERPCDRCAAEKPNELAPLHASSAACPCDLRRVRLLCCAFLQFLHHEANRPRQVLGRKPGAEAGPWSRQVMRRLSACARIFVSSGSNHIIDGSYKRSLADWLQQIGRGTSADALFSGRGLVESSNNDRRNINSGSP